MKKRFDCVEMKRKAQKDIAEHLQGKPVEEQFAYWQGRNADFRKWHEALLHPNTRTRKETAAQRG